MKKKELIELIVVSLMIIGPAQNSWAEDSLRSEKKMIQEGGLNIQMIEYGIGIGGFYNREFRPDIFGGLEFDLILVRDEKELQIRDPFTGQLISINNPNNVILLSLTFALKKRLFSDSIEPTVRPFAKIGGGPVYGMNFPNEDNREDQFLFSGLVFVGIGADFGSSETSLITFDLRFNFLRFSEELGQGKSYNGIAIGAGFGVQF